MSNDEISFEDLTASLRRWAGNESLHVRAAVELLIWDEGWLRRSGFRKACIRRDRHEDFNWIRWGDARAFCDSGPRASASELAVLNLAVTLGGDELGVVGFGHAHKRAAAQAFATACGERLAPAEIRHNHPDFIPGDPATCKRCALEAGKGTGNDAR